MKYRLLLLQFVLINLCILPSRSSCYECLFSEIKPINLEKTIVGVNIQPRHALKIAEPFIEEHATKRTRGRDLQLHITLCDHWYYVMKTDFPAKTIRYYLQPAVKVHTQTGDVSFSKPCK